MTFWKIATFFLLVENETMEGRWKRSKQKKFEINWWNPNRVQFRGGIKFTKWPFKEPFPLFYPWVCLLSNIVHKNSQSRCRGTQGCRQEVSGVPPNIKSTTFYRWFSVRVPLSFFSCLRVPPISILAIQLCTFSP